MRSKSTLKSPTLVTISISRKIYWISFKHLIYSKTKLIIKKNVYTSLATLDLSIGIQKIKLSLVLSKNVLNNNETTNLKFQRLCSQMTSQDTSCG